MAQVPPFAIAETVPADDDFVRLFPAAERLFRDIVESWLSMEHSPTTGRHAFPVDTAANLAALTWNAGSLRYDTTNGVWEGTPDGTDFFPLDFPSGTRIVFQQDSAPIGWTKETDGAFDDAIMRVVTGVMSSSGSTGMSSAVISQAKLPNVNFVGTTGSNNANHTHQIVYGANSFQLNLGGTQLVQTIGTGGSAANSSTQSTNHQHSISVPSGGSGTTLFNGVKIMSTMVAEKD